MLLALCKALYMVGVSLHEIIFQEMFVQLKNHDICKYQNG